MKAKLVQVIRTETVEGDGSGYAESTLICEQDQEWVCGV